MSQGDIPIKPDFKPPEGPARQKQPEKQADQAEKPELHRPDQFHEAKQDTAFQARRMIDLPQIRRFLDRSGNGGESPFEKSLKGVLEGKASAPGSLDGKSASYAPKTETAWRAFFASVLKMGSAETPMSTRSSDIMQAAFRGLFKELGALSLASQKGMTLVSDLYLLKGEKVIADKFARISVDHPELLSALNRLAPGDQIAAEALAKLGAQLTYVQLTHVVESLTAEARDTARTAALQQLKSSVNAEVHSRFEAAVIQGRQRVESEEKKEKKSAGEKGSSLQGGSSQWGWPGGDPRFEREKRLGRPKGWIFFAYSVGTVVALITGYVIFRWLQ